MERKRGGGGAGAREKNREKREKGGVGSSCEILATAAETIERRSYRRFLFPQGNIVTRVARARDYRVKLSNSEASKFPADRINFCWNYAENRPYVLMYRNNLSDYVNNIIYDSLK